MTPDTSYRAPVTHPPSVATVARWLDGEVREGDLAPERLCGLATLGEAGPQDISFIAHGRFLPEARSSQAGLLVTTPEWDLPGRARIVVDRVWPAVVRLMEALYPPRPRLLGVHPTAVLGADVRLGEDVYVGPYAVIGDGCAIGDRAHIGPHCILDADCRVGRDAHLTARVTLMGPVILGERVLIHPGAVLGSDGFRYEMVDGEAVKIPHVGTVVLEDDTEIGANTTIDRAFLTETRIGKASKLDNLVMIAHNVQMGPRCLVAAQSGIAGSARVGAGCIMGGQAGIRDGVQVDDGLEICAQAGVINDISKRGRYIGSPAVLLREFARQAVASIRMPEVGRRLRAIEDLIESLPCAGAAEPACARDPLSAAAGLAPGPADPPSGPSRS